MKIVPFLTPEEIDKLYPIIDKWWRSKHHYFTIDGNTAMKILMEFLDKNGCSAELVEAVVKREGKNIKAEIKPELVSKKRQRRN